MFLPTTRKEMQHLGWDALDVILVTGDAYIDSPYIGVAVIGRVLADAGYRVGIIPQPDVNGDTDITRLGEPLVFWGLSGGCMDSMVANYTATRKRRKQDDLTAGGVNDRRPDRAVIAYTNLIRRYFKPTRPIVIGGIEASLRRISHYDFWTDRIRRSILFDAKADILVYGMGEQTTIALAERLGKGQSISDIRGLCYISTERPDNHLELPSHQSVSRDKAQFAEMFRRFYENSDSITANGLVQLQDTRYLVHNPPAPLPGTEVLDRIYEAGYEREAHPVHRAEGPVRALDTIRFAITTHRGCYGECNFCAIAVHQGRTIVQRSEASVLKEAESLTRHPAFKGIIADVGGPTANMYGMECERKTSKGACVHKRCLVPKPCRHLRISHDRQIRLLKKIRNIEGVRKAFIASGIRHDLIVHDEKFGQKYLDQIIDHHISGQLKIAPEHSDSRILELMGKPPASSTESFINRFDETNRKKGKKQFLTAYFIAAYPGCAMEDMRQLKRFVKKNFRFTPEQVQIFTPSPSTIGTVMYHTGLAWNDGKPIFVEKNPRNKEKQKQAITSR